jgi:hypothetical protein
MYLDCLSTELAPWATFTKRSELLHLWELGETQLKFYSLSTCLFGRTYSGHIAQNNLWKFIERAQNSQQEHFNISHWKTKFATRILQYASLASKMCKKNASVYIIGRQNRNKNASVYLTGKQKSQQERFSIPRWQANFSTRTLQYASLANNISHHF